MFDDTHRPLRELLLTVLYSYWWTRLVVRRHTMALFEMENFRDLEAASIHYTSHDLRVREQRFSPCDLTVSSMTGDIKNKPTSCMLPVRFR